MIGSIIPNKKQLLIEDKKPYKIKFDKKQDILGMGKNKHWALLANRFDGSMLRNRLAMYIASRLGMEYTPKMLPVDLVIDGKYMGSYYLSELVRIGKNRVDIDELTPDDNEEPNITGGYLLAIEPNLSVKPAPEQNTVTTERGEAFSFESPEFYSEDDDDILGTAQQKDYIKEYLNETEEAIFGEDFKNSNGVPYTEYLDVQSAADFWWLQEFTVNSDAFTTSSNYLYKKRDGKLYFGPVWDFDYSMGLLDSETYSFNQSHYSWLTYLRAYNSDYQQLLEDRWKVLNSIITDIVKEGGMLDQYISEQKNSTEDDYALWGMPYSWNKLSGFDEEVEFLRTWLTERQARINENIDTKLDHAYVTVTFQSDGEVIGSCTVAGGTRNALAFPSISYDENKPFYGWEYENGETFDVWNTKIIEDTVLVARYGGNYPDIPEISDEPEISNEPEVSDEPEISDVSKISEVSQKTDTPVNTNSQSTEKSDIQNSVVNSSSQTNPSNATAHTPNTGDNLPLPFFIMTFIISLSTAVFINKKSKNTH